MAMSSAKLPAFLRRALTRCRTRCGPRSASSSTPGIGFGKTPDPQPRVAASPARASPPLGLPLLVGWSRKRRSARLTAQPVGERVAASVGSGLDGGRARCRDLARPRCPRDGRRTRGLEGDGVLRRAESSRAAPDNPGRKREHAIAEAISAPTAFAARSARHRSRPTSCCAWAMRSGRSCKEDRRPTDGADRQGHPDLRLHDRVGARAGFASAGVDVLLTGPLSDPWRRLHDAGAPLEASAW